MNPALIPVIGSLFGKIFDTVQEVVPDKDKQLELTTKLMQHQLSFQQVLIQQTTVPWVDATVKLLYALSDLFKQNWRPVVSAAAFIYGLLNPDLIKELHALGAGGDAAVAAIFGSFPGWMLSRHASKRNGRE